MITWKELYMIISDIVPIYAVVILAYGSVRWWKIFSPNECIGINRYVALFAIPLLIVKFISNNNPYAMNLRFLAADSVQKIMVIVLLSIWCKVSSKFSLDWGITLFQLLILPSTLIMGIALLGAMYDKTLVENLIAQLSALIYIVWFPFVLFLYEYRSATRENLDENKSDDTSTSSCGGGGGTINFSDHDNDDNNGEKIYPAGLPLSNTRSTKNNEVRVGIDEPKMTKKQPRNECMTTKLILVTVFKKLMKNPNFFASILGFIWSLISFRWHISLPPILANTIKKISNTGLGMAMFSLGLFMGSQPSIIAGGYKLVALTTVARFVAGPITTAAAAAVVGLRGTVLQIVIMQAALPQAFLSFVFAKEYNVHPVVMCTAVSFGLLISLPIALLYYIILGVLT